MKKTSRLPETSVRILVRPTIGHLLYSKRSNSEGVLPTATDFASTKSLAKDV